MHKTYQHASKILLEIAENKSLKNKDLSFAYLLQLMGDRAFGMGLLLFALPSALPFSTLPGVAANPPTVKVDNINIATVTIYWLPPNELSPSSTPHKYVAIAQIK